MDVIDFLENMGWGMAVIISVAVILVLLLFFSRFALALLTTIGSLFIGLVGVVLFFALIYFIGKFAKDFYYKMR